MLKLILQQKIGVEAAKEISDELYSTNPIMELQLDFHEDISTSTHRSLLEALGTKTSLESLWIHSVCCKYTSLSADSGFKFSTALEKIVLSNNRLKKLTLMTNRPELPLHKHIKISMLVRKISSLESFRFE